MDLFMILWTLFVPKFLAALGATVWCFVWVNFLMRIKNVLSLKVPVTLFAFKWDLTRVNSSMCLQMICTWKVFKTLNAFELSFCLWLHHGVDILGSKCTLINRESFDHDHIKKNLSRTTLSAKSNAPPIRLERQYYRVGWLKDVNTNFYWLFLSNNILASNKRHT